MFKYCTLFDSNYLSRGLAMYESLKRNSSDFHLYVLAMDENCEKILKELACENMSVISLTEFEDEELKKVKHTRTRGEYCWTCTPSLIKYCIEKFNLDMCTYLDADIYFYSDPTSLFSEMGNASILISPHRYTKIYDQSTTSGIYCVQFVSFKNDQRGIKALEWWRQACNDWCYARIEDGKFGDQKYLDDWPERFEAVHVMQHLGGGIAPWNVQQYGYVNENGRIFGRNKKSGIKFEVIFYHFHNINIGRLFGIKVVNISTYFVPNTAKILFYKPYLKHLSKIERKIFDKFGFKIEPPQIHINIKNIIKFFFPFGFSYYSYLKRILRYNGLF